MSVRVRCADCGETYRHEYNLLTDEMVWLRPKNKRGVSCSHANYEAVNADGELPSAVGEQGETP